MPLNHFQNKTVLITGHTGFKGSWLTVWLKHLGAKIVGISLDPPTNPSHYAIAKLSNDIDDLRIDVRDSKKLEKAIISAQPDFVFHLAAQALVKNSYEDPLETWQTNVLGTLNVLEALRKLDKKCAAVIITSDKCYENVEWAWGYRETDSLGGPDPYSASKGAAELAIRSHIKSFFPKGASKIRIASARAGNVIGGGDWASNRIIPDCVRAWSLGLKVELRNPQSTRPWQHVLEPLSGYLALAIDLATQPKLHGEAFNFGPQAQQNKSVLDLVKKMSLYWDEVRWIDVSDISSKEHESGLLKLNCDKALHYLQWHAVLSFEETMQMTSEWYRTFYEKSELARMMTINQIEAYTKIASKKGLDWAQ